MEVENGKSRKNQVNFATNYGKRKRTDIFGVSTKN